MKDYTTQLVKFAFKQLLWKKNTQPNWFLNNYCAKILHNPVG